jgi:hypothetical protein
MVRHERILAGSASVVGGGSANSLLASAFIAAVLLSMVFLVSCAPKPEKPALIPDDYNTWEQTTEVRLDYPIPGHQDNFRIIYMNDIGFGFSRTTEGQSERVVFPEGTVIAKAIYEGSSPAPGASPMMVTAMVKASDNPDAKGGWVWVTRNLALGKETVIQGDFCFTCHANANEAHPYDDKNPDENFRDYVFFIPGTGY